MDWRYRALIAIGCVCFALLLIGGVLNGSGYQHYQQDLEDNRRECEAERGPKEADHKKECQSLLYRTLDDPVALLTGALTVATIALFIVTFGLYVAAARQGADAKGALVAAKESARAARVSAEASVRAERAIIIATGFNIGLVPGSDYPVPSENIPSSPLFRLSFANIGRTPAEIDTYCVEIHPVKELPLEPEYVRVYGMIPGTYILGGKDMEIKDIFVLEDKTRDLIMEGRLTLTIFGFITWRDYLGDPHETRFCTQALYHPRDGNKWFSFVLNIDTPEAYTRRT